MTDVFLQRENTPFELKSICLPVSQLFEQNRRLEAGVYLSDGFLVRRIITQSSMPVVMLGSLVTISQPGRMTIVDVKPEHGVPYLAATQVFDIWPSPRKWLARDKTPSLEALYVNPNQILVTCSGTVGRVILAYRAHTNFAISSDLLRIDVQGDPSVRSYLYVFLRSEFGRAMMEGSGYGSIIKHLRPDHLEEMPVPMVGSIRSSIHEQVEHAFMLRDEAYELDMDARAIFDSAMADRPSLRHEEGYVVAASRLFSQRRRLEAASASPRAQFVEHVYKRNAKAVVALRTVARAFLPARFRRIYGRQGIAYLDSEPIFKVNPRVTKLLTPATRIDFDTYLVQRGWLLMARSGQIYGINGQAILANKWHGDKVISEHIMRIIPRENKIRPGYLQTVLSHPVLGKPLVVSHAFGTSVPELAPEDIERLPIPRLEGIVEGRIADAAEQASELRRIADETENTAVSVLERELKLRLESDVTSP